MPFRPLSELTDERFPPGTAERRRYEYTKRRYGRILDITTAVYRGLHRIPGAGPVVAQFWHDILNGALTRFEDRREPERSSPGDIFYGALDGLAWRFFDDEYVPTWADVKSGRSGRKRLVWRLRRRHTIEHAEALAEDAMAELRAKSVDE